MAFYFYWGLFSQFCAQTKLGDWREFTFFLILILKVLWKSVLVVSLWTIFWGVLLKRCNKMCVCVIDLKTHCHLHLCVFLLLKGVNVI